MFWVQALLPGIVAASATVALTPWVIRLAFQLQALDEPGGRKRHATSTPRLGGLAIGAGIAVAAVPALLFLTEKTVRSLSVREVAVFALATTLVFVLGLVDDLKGGLVATTKLVVEIIAAGMIVGLGWQFDVVRIPIEGPLQLGIVAPALSVLWIVGVTNAINFIDGLDGLAAGVVGIIATSLLALASLQGNAETVVVTSCIAGACLGFLRHNMQPAKVYMGDSGSLTLGFLLATISLGTAPSVKASTTVAILVPILALGLPVLDTLLVMWYRFLRGKQTMNRLVRMLHADRAHIHHLLLDSQTKRSRVVLILYGMTAFFCLFAMLVAASNNWWLGLSLLGVEFVAVLLVRQSGLSTRVQLLARAQREDLERESSSDGTLKSTEKVSTRPCLISTD